MILEVAILNVVPGRETEFEDAFRQAQAIISTMSGYRSHELRRCIEAANRFL
jgi:heme-degrading monooxygenase HmoA